MNDHQLRIIERLTGSLKSSNWNLDTIVEKQKNLEAFLGVVEDADLNSALQRSISELEECIHIMDDSQGVIQGKSICDSLRNFLKQRQKEE